MRRFVLPFVLALVALVAPPARATTNALAEDHRVAVGFGGGGGVYGVSAKLPLGPSFAVQASAGEWGWPGVGANVDALLEMPQLWGDGTFGVNWYVGAGAGLVYGGAFAPTVTALAGVSFQCVPVPVELTLEFRPTLLLGPELHGLDWFDGGAALRYWF